MNEQRIKKSIETGVLQLSFWLKLNHYGASIFFIIIEGGLLTISFPIYHPIDLFQIVILSIFPLLGIWIFFRKRKKLKFRILEKKIPSTVIHEIGRSVAKQFDWNCRQEQANVILLESKVLLGRGGELITIIITEKHVLIIVFAILMEGFLQLL
jgi:hypothetical protein